MGDGSSRQAANDSSTIPLLLSQPANLLASHCNQQIEDKKLKGKLRYTERLIGEAQASAAAVDEWLLPSEAGGLEAEGMERTWRFKQEDIVKVRVSC